MEQEIIEEIEEQKKIKVEDIRNRQFLVTIHKKDKDIENWTWNEEKAIENVKNFCNNGYDTIWYIKHFKGNEKEEHTHFIVRTRNARKLKQIAKLFELDKEHYKWIEIVKSLKGSLDYLIHKNNPEKVQYKKEDVTTIGQFQYEDMTKEFMTRTQIFNKLRFEENAISELLDNPNIETCDIKSMYYLAQQERKMNVENNQRTIKRLEKLLFNQNEKINQLQLTIEMYEDILNRIAFNIHKNNQQALNEELANTIDTIIYQCCPVKNIKKSNKEEKK